MRMDRVRENFHSVCASFLRCQEGSITWFSLVLFVLMIMMGGMAVDVMRFENARTALQQTLDRSILAAASLRQDRAPQVVVQDYFTKAGLGDQLESVSFTPEANRRVVSAAGDVIVPTFFMHMLDVNSLTAVAAGRAEEGVRNVEVVLVLDVSGSMAGTKLAGLKSAAKEFVDLVKGADEFNRISIEIVPYNAQVNLGVDLRSKYNAAYLHGVPDVNCLEIPATAYDAISLSRTDALPMSAFADMSSSTTRNENYISPTASNATFDNTRPFCRNNTGNIVRFHSDDTTQMKLWIDGLQAAGNTSITLGMKWGLTMLDPATRPMMSELITASKIPASFSGRPFNWDDDESSKVVVLMTDGEHVSHTMINNAFKTGTSPIFRAADGNYSIRHTTGRPTNIGTKEYWVPHLCTSTNCKNGSNTNEAWRDVAWVGPNPAIAAVKLDWNQVWANQRVQWVAWQLYGRALGTASTRTARYDTAMNQFRSTVASVAEMDSQLQKSCTLAKGKSVTVYGIAFEAPVNGQTQISKCASSTTQHYFNASDTAQITAAFRSIASDIIDLRLTQ